MKISLSWIFDYIDHSVDKVDVDQLVHLFNIRTAEIEHYEKVTSDVSQFFLVQVTNLDSQTITVRCAELQKDLDLSSRSDAKKFYYYLIKEVKGTFEWVTLQDFYAEKEGLFPAVHIQSDAESGSWRKQLELTDYVLEVDNKSINHRPDLWGHYGIAREVAAFFDYPLKSLYEFVATQKVVHTQDQSQSTQHNPFSVTIDDKTKCSRFAALYCDKVEHKGTDLFMAARLLRVGARPIDMMVDLTNYVMFDLGHPMHVFDADSFKNKEIVVRSASKDEKLTILDGQELSLRPEDLIVTNSKDPVALAGIMGGKSSGYSEKTKAIVLEAAGFDPTVIRKTAQHFKLRSEASTRFEKHIDPMQNSMVLQRFVFLAQHAGVIQVDDQAITSVGNIVEQAVCSISQDFIQKRLGASVAATFIQDTLKKLGFEVSVTEQDGQKIYQVTVPTYRMTKDIGIKEDIVEEIVRMYGYENIPYEPFKKEALPFSVQKEDMVAQIKNHLAFACRMSEVRDYLFYDESFIKKLQYDPEQTVDVKNPVSENWKRLVTSLVPHLIKNVALNHNKQDHLRFFEWNNIWSGTIVQFEERSSLAGIVFDVKSVDFYTMKAELQTLWDMLGIDITWIKPEKETVPWYDKHKVAELRLGNQVIGYAGMLSEEFVRPVLQGQGFAFELHGDVLATLHHKKDMFQPWSKYQDVDYDISMLVPLKVTADTLKSAILQADAKIIKADIVDHFEKEDWAEHRSLTFRYTMSDPTKTLQKEEIDAIVTSVEKVVQTYGVQIR